MTEQQDRSAKYERARREFDSLQIEDKAIFLVESTVTTVARGIEEVGRVIAHELDALFHPPPSEPDTPPAPEAKSQARKNKAARSGEASGDPFTDPLGDTPNNTPDDLG